MGNKPKTGWHKHRLKALTIKDKPEERPIKYVGYERRNKRAKTSGNRSIKTMQGARLMRRSDD